MALHVNIDKNIDCKYSPSVYLSCVICSGRIKSKGGEATIQNTLGKERQTTQIWTQYNETNAQYASCAIMIHSA